MSLLRKITAVVRMLTQHPGPGHTIYAPASRGRR